MMPDSGRNKRPKRVPSKTSPSDVLGLSWREERDLRRAIYDSLREHKERSKFEEALATSSSYRANGCDRAKRSVTKKMPGDETLSWAEDQALKRALYQSLRERDAPVGFGGHSWRDILSRPSLNRTRGVADQADVPRKRLRSPSKAGFNGSSQPTNSQVIAPRQPVGTVPNELWMDSNGGPVSTHSFVDFLCYYDSPALDPSLAWFYLPPRKRRPFVAPQVTSRPLVKSVRETASRRRVLVAKTTLRQRQVAAKSLLACSKKIALNHRNRNARAITTTSHHSTVRLMSPVTRSSKMKVKKRESADEVKREAVSPSDRQLRTRSNFSSVSMTTRTNATRFSSRTKRSKNGNQ